MHAHNRDIVPHKTRRNPVVLLILSAVVGLILLAVLKIVPLFVALAGILAVLLLAAWRFDRTRGAGARAPYLDANRPDFYGRSSESRWEVPTPYIDHPTGAGEPPGMDRGDEPAATGGRSPNDGESTAGHYDPNAIGSYTLDPATMAYRLDLPTRPRSAAPATPRGGPLPRRRRRRRTTDAEGG
jgi:hypothetical protein